MASSGAALFQSKKLLGTEGFVMDLTGCLDEVLKVCTGEEVSQVDEFAMVLVFDVDNAPTILAPSNLLATYDDCLLASDNSEWNDVLDLSVDGALFVVKLIIVVWIHLQIVEGKFLLYALLESTAFFQCERVRFGNDWNHVDNIGKFLENDNVNWL